MKTVIALALLLAACNHLPIDKGAFASVAGQSTIALGACGTDFGLGWQECLVEKSAAPLPALHFVMTNPGEWAVSDCQNGVAFTGSVTKPGVVDVDLTPMQAQINANGICILKIETVEHYPDPNDSSQTHSIPLRGGLFVEAVTPGYFPHPDKAMLAFCVKVARTTLGRTVVQQCSN